MSAIGRYRKVFVRIWTHPGFTALSDGEKVLALYALSGPQTNRLGLYRLSVATAAEDLKTTRQTVLKRLGRVCRAFAWRFDEHSRVLYIPSHFNWNPPENENVMKGSLKDISEVPPCDLLDAFARNVETLPVTLRQTFTEGLRQRSATGQRNQKQDPDPDQKPNPETAKQNQKLRTPAAPVLSAQQLDELARQPGPNHHRFMCVIVKEVLRQDDTLDLDDESGIVEEVKRFCAEHKIAYGGQAEVPPDAIHVAVAAVVHVRRTQTRIDRNSTRNERRVTS